MSALWDRIDATGRRTIGRTVIACVCRTCGAEIVVGDDDDTCALLAHADPDPIDVTGEALAILTGRPTYQVRRVPRGFELDRRDWRDLHFRPAGIGADVLAWHMCDAPLPRAAWLRPVALNTSPAHTEPPF